MTPAHKDIVATAARLRAMADDLDRLAGRVKRRSPVKRAAKSSVPMTEQLGAAIRAYAQAFPEMAQHEIAAVFKVNHGRVSEALAGAVEAPLFERTA